MVKTERICNICKENESNIKFKVKMDKKTRRSYRQMNGMHNIAVMWGGWKPIDICEDCYKKLFGVSAGIENYTQIPRPSK